MHDQNYLPWFGARSPSSESQSQSQFQSTSKSDPKSQLRSQPDAESQPQRQCELESQRESESQPSGTLHLRPIKSNAFHFDGPRVESVSVDSPYDVTHAEFGTFRYP